MWTNDNHVDNQRQRQFALSNFIISILIVDVCTCILTTLTLMEYGVYPSYVMTDCRWQQKPIYNTIEHYPYHSNKLRLKMQINYNVTKTISGIWYLRIGFFTIGLLHIRSLNNNVVFCFAKMVYVVLKFLNVIDRYIDINWPKFVDR